MKTSSLPSFHLHWSQVDVPIVGTTRIFGLYLGSIRYMFDAKSIFEKGYRKVHFGLALDKSASFNF